MAINSDFNTKVHKSGFQKKPFTLKKAAPTTNKIVGRGSIPKARG